MAARLGDVVYWLCLGVAVIIAAAGLGEYAANSSTRSGWYAMIVIAIAALTWLFGKAARYVLSGR